MRQRGGVVIPNVGADEVHVYLNTWFESRHDQRPAPQLTFERNVLCVDVGKTTTPSSSTLLDEATLQGNRHPLLHAVIVRYSYESRYKELTIWNAAEVDAATHPYPRSLELEPDAYSVDEAAHFHLTHCGDPLDAMHWVLMHEQHLSLGELLERELPRKIRSYLDPSSSSHHQHPHSLIECAAALIAALVGERLESLHPPCGNKYDRAGILAHYHGKRFRTLYEKARHHMECQVLLPARLAPFCSQHTLLKLLKWNGMETWMNKHCRPGTAADYRAFRKHYPGAFYAPSVFFEIPCSEWSGQALPVYPQGLVRLPCYAPAILTWLQQRWLIHRDARYHQEERGVGGGGGAGGGAGGEALGKAIYWAVDREARRLYRHYFDLHYAPRPPDVLKLEAQQRLAQRFFNNAPGAGDRARESVPDIEELWSMLPPCVRAVRALPHFPKHHQRNKMALIMWHGGVNEASIWNLMETLPEPPPRELWQLEDEKFNKKPEDPYLMRERQAKVQAMLSAPGAVDWKPICRNIVADTLAGNQHVLHCPYVRAATAGKSLTLDETRITCNNACNDDELFGGAPSHLVAKALYRKSYLQEEEEKKKVQENARWREGIDDTLDKPLKARDDDEDDDDESSEDGIKQ